MASKRPLRTLYTIATSTFRTTHLPRRSFPEVSACAFSTSTPLRDLEHSNDTLDQPRWRQTPARMVAPLRTRPRPEGPEFKVNEDPRKLDEVYLRMLGPDGDKMLSEEVKWLAITHKSFDHGRRGFNDRLAFLGRRIVSLQTSLALLNSPQAPKPTYHEFGRVPYEHPALSGLLGLTAESKDRVLDKNRLASVAQRYGLDRVIRWKPRRTDNLQAAGIDAVLSTSLYAIVGAIALERGGEAANKVTKDKILAPLGFTWLSAST